MRKKTLQVAAIILALISVYLIISPFWEDIVLPFKKLFDATDGYHYVNQVNKTDNSDSILKPIPLENTLVIPKIQVDTPIISSSSESALNSGVWHKPLPGNPLTGGNMVLTAHRFLYLSGPNTFYHLDKLAVGDSIIIYWQAKEYDYSVFETKVIAPTETWVEDETTDNIVTLYTCTYNAENRILVRAKLIAN